MKIKFTKKEKRQQRDKLRWALSNASWSSNIKDRITSLFRAGFYHKDYVARAVAKDILQDIAGLSFYTDEVLDIIADYYGLPPFEPEKYFTNKKALFRLSDEEFAASRIHSVFDYWNEQITAWEGDFEGTATTREEAIQKEIEWLNAPAPVKYDNI